MLLPAVLVAIGTFVENSEFLLDAIYNPILCPLVHLTCFFKKLLTFANVCTIILAYRLVVLLRFLNGISAHLFSRAMPRSNYDHPD
jgi:hypothetical protein